MNNKNLFNETITDRDSWSNAVESKEKPILPILKYIYETNNIKLKNTDFIKYGFGGQSTYRADDTVIKIFSPPEIILHEALFYNTELNAMKFCRNLGVLTPDIICTGTIHDRYNFPYIVMNYIDGIRADKTIDVYNKSEKTEYMLKLKETADKIHIPTDINIPRYDDPSRDALWNIMPESFREDRKCYLSNIIFPNLVFQHGDLGAHNIIIDKKFRLNVIDFSESITGPSYYEWRHSYHDAFIMETYFSGYKKDELYEMFLQVWLVDWFCPIGIKWCAEEMGIDYTSITSVDALKNMIIKRLEGSQV